MRFQQLSLCSSLAFLTTYFFKFSDELCVEVSIRRAIPQFFLKTVPRVKLSCKLWGGEAEGNVHSFEQAEVSYTLAN